MIYRYFCNLDEMSEFLKPYNTKDVIISINYESNDYNIWINAELTMCKKCKDYTDTSGKYCQWCGAVEFLIVKITPVS